tara:strand:- start:80 stop:1789 length:1710 start_codon:yes stop_codon:yes gene_type:complete
MSNAIRRPAIEEDVVQKLHCYLRVSSEGQLEGHSIENQRSNGKRIANKLGFTYVELNEGAKSSSRGIRPVFEELKNGIRDGEIKNIWYYSRNRWTRTTIEDLLMKKNYFKKYKTVVYEGESGARRNFADAKEEFMDTMLTTVQQLDREQRREVSVSGKRHLSLSQGKNGVFMGGTINFGYENVDKKWTINKEEAKYVNLIFSMYLQDKSLKQIKTYLDTQGVKPRRSKLWNIGTLLSFLNNRTYLGEYKWFDKEIQQEYNIVIPQIISHSMFKRVQKKIGRNTINKGNNTRQYTSLLSDFLVCYCGEKIAGNVRKTVNKKVYVCSSKHNKWKGKNVEFCENRRGMNMDVTDAFVVKQIKEVMGNSSILKDRFKKDVLSKKDIDSSQIELEKKFLENKLKIIDKQRDTTIQSISTNEVRHLLKKVDDEVYEQIKIALDEERTNLEDKKSQYIGEINELDNRKDWINWITKYGDDINKRFENPTTELLEGMIESILVSPTLALNRDEIEKQVGHKIIVNFLQPIVDDGIEYLTDVKSDGYNVVNGKKKLDVGQLDIQKGGRGNFAKKNHRI